MRLRGLRAGAGDSTRDVEPSLLARGGDRASGLLAFHRVLHSFCSMMLVWVICGPRGAGRGSSVGLSRGFFAAAILSSSSLASARGRFLLEAAAPVGVFPHLGVFFFLKIESWNRS
jgi:hypothetical protein